LKTKVIGQSSRSHEETSSAAAEMADRGEVRIKNKQYRKADLILKLQISNIGCVIVWSHNSISCRWRIRATRCITVNVLQTKVDAQCDKLATELSCQRLQRSTFSSYSELLIVESRLF